VRAIDDVIFERHLSHRRGNIPLGPPATNRLANRVDHDVEGATERGHFALVLGACG